MHFTLLSLIFLFSLNTQAEEEKIEYKSWKTFQSDYGYEFKYPDCWELMIDDPDEKGDFQKIHNLTTIEGNSCKTPRRDKEIPNSVAFRADYKSNYYDSIKEADEKKNRLEKWSRAERKNGRNFYFKRNKIENTESIDYVELLSNRSLRWRRELFCDQRRISVSGPSIMTPNSEYIEKLKTGDFALPEPEKTIYDSIKCIEPKIQNDRKKK